MTARAWLLSYAQIYGDTSPLCDSLFLPAGRKQYFYAVYYRDRVVREVPRELIVSLPYFLKMWRTELPWVQLRSATGPFTHCGLCDFMKMMIGSTQDPGMKHILLMRLGEHYEFQAAQRIAMNNIFAESERHPSEVLAASWDKMDQAKNIFPRVKVLANTQFMKGGSRIFVSLIGVLIPAVSQKPWFYTIFEDQVQGSDMISSLMVDVLLEAVGVLGQLPRRFVIQADNTAKETKNTITLSAAAWLMAQLQHTRLEQIEFCYLVVGHTHDLIDATFAFVSKAVCGHDVLSLPDFFSLLNRKMKNAPLWKHLRDVFAFKECQPAFLKSKTVKGITGPHHVRLSWGRDGSINVQSKQWLTSEEWSKPLCLCNDQQVRELRRLSYPAVPPEWPQGFPASSVTWLQKLQNLLTQAGKPSDGLAHCAKIVRHEFPEYLPSGASLQSKIAQTLQKGENVGPYRVQKHQRP